MRLLKDEGHGDLILREYRDDQIPPYAILSHTWGADSEEVTFKDIHESTGRSKAGYKKIEFCRGQAASDGLQHFWIDTCCIKKSSSAELSEAINSMFRWYENADICYVLLSDFSMSGHVVDIQSLSITWKAAFQRSQWFSRGWTLQELIAPPLVEFFSSDGSRLGNKKSLEQQIHETTGIAIEALRGEPLTRFEIEERFSWAKHRETSRQEDRAYSLLGIFNVYMPLIYGEGELNAIERLRRKIRKRLTSSVEHEQELKTTKKVLGPKQLDKLDTMDKLVLTYLNQRRWKKAEGVYVQALERTKRVLGPEHPHIMTSMANLAWIYRTQGRQKEAEELQLEVIEMVKKMLGPEHPDTLICVANLEHTYQNQQHWNKVERLKVQVLETRKRVLGLEHPDTLTSMANLASTYWDQARRKEAEELQVQVLETRKRVLGLEHPDTLSSIAKLVSIYRIQGRRNEVEEQEVQLMEMRKRVLGPEHPLTLAGMHHAAWCFQQLGRKGEAIELMAECVQLRNRILHVDHPDAHFSAAILAEWQASGPI